MNLKIKVGILLCFRFQRLFFHELSISINELICSVRKAGNSRHSHLNASTKHEFVQAPLKQGLPVCTDVPTDVLSKVLDCVDLVAVRIEPFDGNQPVVLVVAIIVMRLGSHDFTLPEVYVED